MNRSSLQLRAAIPLILILFITGSSIAQNKTWSLVDCVDHALENNITILKSENTLLLDEQDIKAAKGNFLPTVNAGINQNLSLGNIEVFAGSFVDRTFIATNPGISVNQTVFNGFRNTYLYRQSLLNLETDKLELQRIKDDISLNVANAYLNVLFNKENLETAEEQYEFSRKQLEQVRELVDAGVQPRANIYDAEATLSSDAQSVTVAENNYDLSLLSLAQLLQVPFEGFEIEIIEVDDPSAALMYDDVQPILDYAFENRVEIKVAEKNMENAVLNTEISKSGYLPSVTFGYGFNSAANFSNLSEDNSFFQQINDNKGHTFRLDVSIPIFSGFRNKTAVAKSRIMEENSKLDLEQARLNLESNIQRAYTDARAALKSYTAAQKSLESQEISFENSQERYNLGSMNSFDLEQARIRLVNAQSLLINAKYDFIFKTKVLDFYLGKTITF